MAASYPRRLYGLVLAVIVDRLVPYLKASFSNPLSAYTFAMSLLALSALKLKDQVAPLAYTYIQFVNDYYIIHAIALVWIPVLIYKNSKYLAGTDSRRVRLFRMVGVSSIEGTIMLSSFIAVSMSFMSDFFGLPPELSYIVVAYGITSMLVNIFVKNRLVAMMTNAAGQ